MIPLFPLFKKLELSDKSDIEKITQKYPPYSDFNFMSMWSWDTKKIVAISLLNNNLIVRFNDYITNDIFYSFFGEFLVDESIDLLMNLLDKESLPRQLKLVPEMVIKNITNTSKYNMIEDLSSFDYLYYLDKLKTYDGNKLRSKRNLSNRFKKLYLDKTKIKILNSHNQKIRNEIFALLDIWVNNKKNKENQNELIAIHRALEINEINNLVFVGIFIEEIFAGFVINELTVQKEFAIIHFEKADADYIGIYAYLMQENAKILSSMGKKILNYEQDLGLPGLRLGKKSFRPMSYLKKYLIQAQ